MRHVHLLVLGLIVWAAAGTPGLAQDGAPKIKMPPAAKLGADMQVAINHIPTEFATTEVNLTDEQWLALVKVWKEQVKPIDDSVKKIQDADSLVAKDTVTAHEAATMAYFGAFSRRLTPLLAVLTPEQRSLLVTQYEATIKESCAVETPLCKLVEPQVKQLRAQIKP